MKFPILIAIIVLVGIVTSVLFIQKPGVKESVATVRYIKAGHVNIACEDAEWLLEKMPELIREGEANVAAYEKANSVVLEEEQWLKIFNSPTKTQQELEVWSKHVLYALDFLFEKDPERREEVYSSIAYDYNFIYDQALAMHEGDIDRETVYNTIQEEYCTGDRH